MKMALLQFSFFIAKLLNSFVPKSDKRISFISRPDFSDNAYYMYRYMKKKGVDKKLSWIVYDKTIYQQLSQKGYENIYYIKSLQGMLEYVRSKYIITSSSSLWQIKSPFQKQYDLWHGIPLKNVLCMGEKGIKAKRQAGNITKRFATSSLVKALLAASFDFNALKIEITGQPRTDALFSPKGDIEEMLDVKLEDYSKIVIYMPTYRHGYRSKKEGKKFGNDNIFRMERYSHQRFLDYLKQENILFLLKLHPYEEKMYKNIDLGENIFWINNEKMIEYSMNIYDVLAHADTLITDYSSVYFDFLLLDRRIVFVAPDLQVYKDNRGFEIEPYEFWTPGEKVFDQYSLERALMKGDTEEESEARKTIRNILHSYHDGYSSKRVWEVIQREMKGIG